MGLEIPAPEMRLRALQGREKMGGSRQSGISLQSGIRSISGDPRRILGRFISKNPANHV
jgi:hypothetical protein